MKGKKQTAEGQPNGSVCIRLQFGQSKLESAHKNTILQAKKNRKQNQTPTDHRGVATAVKGGKLTLRDVSGQPKVEKIVAVRESGVPVVRQTII